MSERKMFGGVAFMFDGNMAFGIIGSELMARLGPAAEEALTEPHVRPMDFTGKPMKGMVYIGQEGIADDADLERWVRRALAFARSLHT
jgi:TfoX/Sxy family transcriptional regulator of competence genes